MRKLKNPALYIERLKAKVARLETSRTYWQNEVHDQRRKQESLQAENAALRERDQEWQEDAGKE